MSRPSFRPQLESLGERSLPSATPALSINDVAHVEGTSGQTAFVFTVTLSQPSKQAVGVKYATADGTATVAGNDYVPAAGTLTFAGGQTVQTLTVLVNGSTASEPEETFLVRLSGASRAAIADGTGVGTIQPNVLTAVEDSYQSSWSAPFSGNVLSNDTPRQAAD